MKLEKITHDHLLTKWLKVIIFAILMLAPIFSVAIRCAYVVCNKNAYQSYYGETINEKIETQVQYNTLQDNEIYLFSNPIVENTNITDVGYMFVTDVVNVNGFANNADLSQVAKIRFYKTSNYNTFQFWDVTETTQIASFGMNTASAQFTFRFKGYSTGYTGFQYANYFYSVSYNKYSYLDNVFDYSVNQIKNDQLFNWTQQTGVYTGVNAMTTGLGLTDGTISILITYWTLLSIIYVIIDIVLEGFVALTHMILKKAS